MGQAVGDDEAGGPPIPGPGPWAPTLLFRPCFPRVPRRGVSCSSHLLGQSSYPKGWECLAHPPLSSQPWNPPAHLLSIATDRPSCVTPVWVARGVLGILLLTQACPAAPTSSPGLHHGTGGSPSPHFPYASLKAWLSRGGSGSFRVGLSVLKLGPSREQSGWLVTLFVFQTQFPCVLRGHTSSGPWGASALPSLVHSSYALGLSAPEDGRLCDCTAQLT